MRRSFRMFGVLALVALIPLACGKKGDEKGGGGSAGAGTSPVAVGGAGGTGGGREADGPARFSEADIKKLAETTIEGFDLGRARLMGTMATIFYTGQQDNAHGRKAAVQVTVSGCMGCLPMDDMAAWEGRKENLMMNLSRAHKENPDAVFELAQADFGGKTVVYTYSLSLVERKTEHGTSRSSSNGITVFYNNGVNQLIIQVSGRGGRGSDSTVEELASNFTKEEMLAAAQTAFAAFVGAY